MMKLTEKTYKIPSSKKVKLYFSVKSDNYNVLLVCPVQPGIHLTPERGPGPTRVAGRSPKLLHQFHPERHCRHIPTDPGECPQDVTSAAVAVEDSSPEQRGESEFNQVVITRVQNNQRETKMKTFKTLTDGYFLLQLFGNTFLNTLN